MNVWSWLSLAAQFAIAIAATSVPTLPAFAEAVNVTTLGVRSADADDQLERRASQQLRTAARSIESFRVSDRDVSLAQMSLAHGCEEIDAECLGQVAETLSADRLLYGNMVRSGDKVRITLFNFNAHSGQIESSADRVLGPVQLSDPTFGEQMVLLVQKVAGVRGKATGALRITGNRPGALVSVDGIQAGRLDEDGELLLRKVGEGPHTISVVTADGRDQRDLSVEVRPDTTTTLRAMLTPPLPQVSDADDEPLRGPVQDDSRRRMDSRKLRRVLGWTSLGVTAGFAAATIYSWVRIKNIGDSKTLSAYREQWPRPDQPGGISNACREAENYNLTRVRGPGVLALETEAHNLCDEGAKLEKLQYVFLSGTVLFGATGAVLLLTSRNKGPSRSLSVSPSFGWGSATVDASYRF